VLESEASALLALGIGKHLKASELLVFGAKGKLIDNSLRFSNEPARHKMLDFVGDIALSGIELVGQILAYRSGHPLNVQLARSILDLHEKALQKENRRAA
jgi:UDP-3-O-acyl-N-acetylglucosamine deacetylase